MLNNLFYVILFSLSFCLISAQQGKYTRKSVSSLETVWVKPGALKNISQIDTKILNNFMEFYIEVPRFDFNSLPKKQINSFINQANALDSVNAETLSEVMENTVLKDVLEILNDPEIQMERGKKLKSDSDLQSFAATKAKSLGLTTEQLASLMNSAYIYLPYIKKMELKKEDNDLKLSMEGGIIWWQVKVGSGGTVEAVNVLDATTNSSSIIDLKAKDLITKKVLKYDEYSFGDKTFKTTPETYVQGGAMLAFAKNLGVKTKELSDFKLQAQIQEKNFNRYNFKLGLAEGVHLDDGFFLVEMTEDNKGNEKAVDIGFLRISKTGKNKKDPLALSSAVQLYGKKGDVGSLVMEHPRLGIDTRVRIGNRIGMYIHPNHTLGLIEEIAEDAFMLDIDFSYNLAPIINSSQTFLDFGFSIGVPNSPLSETAIDEEMAALVWDVGLGLSKKIWFGRMNVPLGLSYQFQSLSLAGEKTQISLLGHAASVSAGFEYMINANTIFHIGIEQNIPFGIALVKITQEDEEDLDYDSEEDLAPWNEDEWWYDEEVNALSLGGTTLRVGIDYSLGEMSFDLFGFLDPYKKY